MKKFSIKSFVAFTRVGIAVLLLCMGSLFLSSFIASSKIGDDVWKQLGLNKQQGTEGIYRSFINGYLDYYQAGNAKNILAGNRVAVTKDLLTYVKQYINSDAFKKEYSQERVNAKPGEPELKPIHTKAELQKQEIAKTEKSLLELDKNMKEMDAEMQKNMLPMKDMFKKMLKEYQNPNHPYFEGLALMEKSDNEQRIKSHKAYIVSWEKNYPADYTAVIKARLQKFLDVTKDVDFDAALKTAYGKKVFVNPVYERKSPEWKQAFRAGKDVTTFARSFATQWLSEIK